MELQCECGKFRAEMTAFPKNTPGRLVCYCDDCQLYLHHLQRADLLDENGGTEVIPAYPADVKITSGEENLKCLRLSAKGMFRFSTSCCNTPVANVRPGTPWIGFHRRVFTTKDPIKLDQACSSVRASIMGRYAKGTPPKGTPQGLNAKGLMMVMPFLLRGFLLRKASPSPFFEKNGTTPIVDSEILTPDEWMDARISARV